MTTIKPRSFVLCGGRATRLSGILPDTPKFLAPFCGRRFADHLFGYLAGQALTDVVLCTGDKADQIREYCGNGKTWGLTIDYSHETCPMGTAGALRLAERFFLTDSFIINGDSIIESPLAPMWEFHRNQHASFTIGCVTVTDTHRFGRIFLDGNGEIQKFEEKGRRGSGVINAGYYVASPSILRDIPRDRFFSVELDLLPKLMTRGLFGFDLGSDFRDIGTPEDLLLMELGDRADRKSK